MVQTGAAGRERPTAAAHSWVSESLLRVFGALLQFAATWAVVRVLPPEDAGIYFRGFVIALGLSTLLRGKYEIYMAQHIIGRRALTTQITDGMLLLQLARRVLVRSSILCAVLLVVIADLDIQAPQLQTLLQTYLPFVLAVPCVSVSSLFCEALRAANRTLGIVVAAYALNLSISLSVLLAPPHAALAFYAWAFLFGCVVSAGLAAVLVRRVFPVAPGEGAAPIRSDALRGLDSRELVGVARGLLLWGPICILAIFAAPVEMAQYAVAVRTALIVDIFLPALNLTGCRETLSSAPHVAMQRRQMLKELTGAFMFSAVCVLPLLVTAQATLNLYGKPYDSQLTVYGLLLWVQFANGIARPAVRRAVVEWDTKHIGVAVGIGALASVLICALGVNTYGALAAAAASLIGALIFNGRAIGMALSRAA